MCLNKFVLTVDCAGASYVGTYVHTYVRIQCFPFTTTWPQYNFMLLLSDTQTPSTVITLLQSMNVLYTHKDVCTYILQGKYRTSRGYLHLSASGYIWLHLATSGYIWLHLATSGYIWVHLGTFGCIWVVLVQSDCKEVHVFACRLFGMA